MKNLALTIIVALMLSACANAPQESKMMTVKLAPSSILRAKNDKGYIAEKDDANAVADETVRVTDVKLMDPVAPKSIKPDTAKKITKEGEISFETGNVVQTRKSIIYAVEKAGGYVAEDIQNKEENSGVKQYMLKARIPSKNFDKVLDTISGAADRIDSKNISIKDVTTEYIDIKSRLDNKKKLESSYLTLLNKAGKMSDILQIEAKLSEIRSDIESTQGQLNYKDKQVAFSSLDITFYSRSVVAANNDGFGFKLRTALSTSVDILQSTFFGIIASWPIILGCVLVFLIFKRYSRKRSASTAV